jgi:hypothetical protein
MSELKLEKYSLSSKLGTISIEEKILKFRIHKAIDEYSFYIKHDYITRHIWELIEV